MKVKFSTNFWRKNKKIVRVVFEKNIKVSHFGLMWRRFREYLQIKNFFQKSGCITFLPLKSSNFMQRIRNAFTNSCLIGWLVGWKLRYQPTNQQTNQPNSYYQQQRLYGTWLALVLWYISMMLLVVPKQRRKYELYASINITCS